MQWETSTWMLGTLIIMNKELKEAEGEDIKGIVDKSLEILMTWKESSFKVLKVMDKEIWFHPTIYYFYTGINVVSLLKEVEYLVMGNVGDSWEVLGMRDDNSLINLDMWMVVVSSLLCRVLSIH